MTKCKLNKLTTIRHSTAELKVNSPDEKKQQIAINCPVGHVGTRLVTPPSANNQHKFYAITEHRLHSRLENI
jgi:hypothetical protein